MSTPSNVTSNVSLSTRLSVWLRSIPLITRSIFILCTAIYLFELLFGSVSGSICEQPTLVLFKLQVWRVFTNAWFHVGILHLVMNMLSFLPMGTNFERNIGSLSFTYLVILFSVLIGILHTTLAAISYYVFQYPGFMVECGVGFSGVLFGLLVITSMQSSGDQSVFGFFTVRAHLYPWVLLVLIQLLMPGVSFLGHLSGILIGYAYVYGLTNWCLLKPSWMNSIESSRIFGWLINRDGYISNPHLGSSAFQPRRSGQQGFFDTLLPMIRPQQTSQTNSFSGGGQSLGSAPRPSNAQPTVASPPSSTGQSSGTQFPGTGYTLGGSSN